MAKMSGTGEIVESTCRTANSWLEFGITRYSRTNMSF